jgi:hypothetical protein
MSRIDVPPPEDHVSRSVVGFRIGAKCMVIAKTTGKPWPTVEDVDAGGRRGFRGTHPAGRTTFGKVGRRVQQAKTALIAADPHGSECADDDLR